MQPRPDDCVLELGHVINLLSPNTDQVVPPSLSLLSGLKSIKPSPCLCSVSQGWYWVKICKYLAVSDGNDDTDDVIVIYDEDCGPPSPPATRHPSVIDNIYVNDFEIFWTTL